ncbi:hypothetical protein HYDPIDRAFT_100550, partial [Hydnomerulius pinastri MD-312]
RYRHVPTFGRSTIRCFRRNVSELKRMAARDFEDMLQASLLFLPTSTAVSQCFHAMQCAMPVFAGLLPALHDSQVLKLLFLLAHWHGLAKLQMHTEETLGVLESVTCRLGNELRMFVGVTCAAFLTKELSCEAEAHRKQQARENAGGGTNSSTNISNAGNHCPKVLNLQTYKLHALGDYAAQIRLYGTTDSYTSQAVRCFISSPFPTLKLIGHFAGRTRTSH